MCFQNKLSRILPRVLPVQPGYYKPNNFIQLGRDVEVSDELIHNWIIISNSFISSLIYNFPFLSVQISLSGWCRCKFFLNWRTTCHLSRIPQLLYAYTNSALISLVDNMKRNTPTQTLLIISYPQFIKSFSFMILSDSFFWKLLIPRVSRF